LFAPDTGATTTSTGKTFQLQSFLKVWSEASSTGISFLS
jgi:hypothetical protein